jgi:hypothetical protein
MQLKAIEGIFHLYTVRNGKMVYKDIEHAFKKIYILRPTVACVKRSECLDLHYCIIQYEFKN